MRKLYRLRHVHYTFYFCGGCRISRDFHAGPYGFMSRGCNIGPGVTAGSYVMFAPEVSIVGSDHCFDIPGKPIIFSGRPPLRRTIIEDDVWLGYRAVIMAGTTIGRGSIVGAGAAVIRDVEPYSIVAGVPAKVVNRRFYSESDMIVHDAMLNKPPQTGTYCLSKEP